MRCQRSENTQAETRYQRTDDITAKNGRDRFYYPAHTNLTLRQCQSPGAAAVCSRIELPRVWRYHDSATSTMGRPGLQLPIRSSRAPARGTPVVGRIEIACDGIKGDARRGEIRERCPSRAYRNSSMSRSPDRIVVTEKMCPGVVGVSEL